MARWFNKGSDRLNEEIDRLEKNKKRLKKQAALIEQQLAQPVQEDEKEITRRAKFKLDPPSSLSHTDSRKKKRLRVHHKRARNRFFVMLGILFILAFILLRLLF